MKVKSELDTYLNALKDKQLGEIETIKTLYYFVRDDIKFGFLNSIDNCTAGETFELRMGQCNNKTILFFEMLRYFNFNVKAHFSTIDKNIQKGFFPSFMLWIVPEEIGHSWIDIEVNGKWIQLDGYINDNQLFMNAVKLLKRKKLETGYSVAEGGCGASSEFSIDNDNFVQMEAVKVDYGSTRDPLTYLRSNYNPNNINFIKKIVYKLTLPVINARVRRLRNGQL